MCHNITPRHAMANSGRNDRTLREGKQGGRQYMYIYIYIYIYTHTGAKNRSSSTVLQRYPLSSNGQLTPYTKTLLAHAQHRAARGVLRK